VRNRAKAVQLFDNNPLLTIHTGDVLDSELLSTLSRDVDFIFHGVNYPYHLWKRFMKPVTNLVIEAASQNRATILFPGNIYAYGDTEEPIKEETISIPTTTKGKLRDELETLLSEAANHGKCEVINLRLPDFYGPNVTNGLIKPLFGNAAKGKSMQWMIRADIPHQFVYTPDAAKLFFWLSQESGLPPYYVLNYGGKLVPTMQAMARTISSLAGSTNRLKLFSRPALKMIGWFVPVVRELNENLYQFEKTIVLDDSKLRSKYPDFKETELKQSIEATINWFRRESA
jgi:nucleoside-diphosphate-sugar epimerase